MARPRPRSLLAVSALAIAVALGVLCAPAFGAVTVPVPKLPNTKPLNTTKALRDCDRGPIPPPLAARDYNANSPSDPNPLLGEQFFVSPVEPSWKTWRKYRRQRKNGSAALMWKIASQPKFGWFGRWTRPRMGRKIREYLRCVQVVQPGAVPLMVVLRHQGPPPCENGPHNSAKEDARTRKWYRNFRRAVGGHRVVIGFEVDSLGTLDCFRGKRSKRRLQLIRYGVDQVSKIPNATVYIEAGASDWEKASRTARQLRYVGIHKVRGFMLNATHYDWTRNNITHGLAISRRTGGKPFIISTSWNGRGPVHFRRYYAKNKWRNINVNCHPRKRGAGINPTTNTHHPKVDAYMWIGRTGYSGGGCNGGPLPVGSWWPERAMMMARNQTTWLGPPPGTKWGWKKRYTLRQLGWCGDGPCP